MSNGNKEKNNGSNSNDSLVGSSADEKVDGKSGDDVVSGGSGEDWVKGGSGDDKLVYVVGLNADTEDLYDGGSGTNILELQMTRAEWMRDDVQADIAGYLAFLGSNAPSAKGKNNSSGYEFTSLGLTARRLHGLEVVVDGVAQDPKDFAVQANDDYQTSDQEHSVLAGNVLDNDDVPDLVREVVLIAGPAKGTLTLASDGRFTYDPGMEFDSLALGESVQVSFRYLVSDADRDSDTATVYLTITGTNDGPVANIDTGSTDENAALTIDVLANDTDVDTSDTHTIKSASIVSGLGNVTIVNNQIEWKPGTDYDYLAVGESASIAVAYTMADNNGAESSSNLTITVTGSNDGPVAEVDVGTTDENASLVLNVLANDTDVDVSDTLTIKTATLSFGLGSVAIANNQLRWTPGQDYDYLAVGESATVIIDYTMSDNHGAQSSSSATITVTGSNDGPIANVDTGSTQENATLLVDVLANDTDVDISDTKSVISATIDSGLGSVAIVSNQIEWTPGTDYDYLAIGESATVSIDYTMADNNGAESSSVLKITVTGSNDAPVAKVDSGSTDENEILVVDVLANDTDVDASDTHSVQSANVASGLGTVAIVSNQVQWSPGTDYDYLAVGESATVLIDYQMADEHGAESSSQLAVTVKGANDGPVAKADTDSTDENRAVLVDVLANDSDVDLSDTKQVVAATVRSGLGSVAIVGPQLEWNPGTDYDYLALGESASVVIEYTMKDNHGAQSSSTLTLSITGSNDRPVAKVDAAAAEENQTVLVNVLANDSDVDVTDTLTVNAASVSSGLGSAAVVGNQVQWSPGSDYDYLAVGETATATVSYSITDNHGATATSQLDITITGTNDTPVANQDSASTGENSRVLIDVLANDSDLDVSDTHTVETVTIASGLGTVAIVNNQVEWIPGSDYDSLAVGETASVVIDYTMADQHGATSSSTINLTVTGSNDIPVAGQLLSKAISEQDPDFTLDLLAGASDVDNNALLSVSNFEVAEGKGGWTLDGNQLTINPHFFDALSNGEQETLHFTYKVQDEHGASVEQTLSVNIDGFTDAPSLAAIASAGTTVNELKVTIASEPANNERVELAFSNLPIGARVLNATRADVTSGVNSFSGVQDFFVVLPAETDADFDFGITASGIDTDGNVIGSASGSIDIVYDHSQTNEQVTFSSQNQGIWASGPAPMVQWHEYVPIIGGKTQAWNPLTEQWEDTGEGPWTSGSFSLFSAEVSAEQAKGIALAGAQATLNTARDVFESTSTVVDQAVTDTYNAAVAALPIAVAKADEAFNAASSAAETAFNAAITGISRVAADAAHAAYDVAVGAAAAARDAYIVFFGWLPGETENAWNVYYGAVSAAAAVRDAALATAEWSEQAVIDAAQFTYDAAIQAANAVRKAAGVVAHATFNAAEAVYDAAKQAAYDAAEAVFNTAQDAFNEVASALDTLQGKTSLDVNADLFAEVGLQIDFVLDSGSVDTEVKYNVASTLQHNKSSDTLVITPHLVNQTTGDAVAFETISPNASLQAILLYDVGVNLNILLDSNLFVGNTVIWDLTPGSGPVNLGTTVTTGGWAEDFEKFKDDIAALPGAVNLDGISVGELVLIDINTANLDQFEVPFIGTLTEDIVSIELGLPTVQAQGKAANYTPDYYTEGGFIAVDFGEIVGSVMNLVNARLDFSPELRQQLGLGSLQETESFGAAIQLLGEAFMGTLFSALSGQADGTPVFLLDAKDESGSSFLHLNAFPDSVMTDSVNANTGKFGFFTGYDESNDLVKVTIDVDQAVAVIVNKIVEAAAAAASSGSTVSFLQALPDINPLDLSFGLEEMLEVIEAPKETIDQLTKYFDLSVGFEAADLDVYTSINFSQEFSLSLDDMAYHITMEDGVQYLFAANAEGSVKIENASKHDADGDGVVDYELSMVPKALFSNDTEIGLSVGYVLDFLEAAFEANLILPLDELLDIEGLPGIPLNLADLELGPLLRIQGDLDLASADIFEARFDFDLGSAEVNGNFETTNEELVTLIGVMPV